MKLYVFTLTILSTFLFGATIHVPGDRTSIQSGLNSANPGDTVMVASGTYYENIIWPQTQSIKLLGSGADSCIIDGNHANAVMRFFGTLYSTTVVDGFTLTNGKNEVWDGYGGGGISVEGNADVSFSNLIIRGNSSGRGNGGGVSIYNGSPHFLNVQIINNTAPNHGGGIYCREGNPVFENVLIESNEVTGGGYFTSIFGAGGGAYFTSSEPVFDSVTVRYNQSHLQGGGLAFSNSQPEFIENSCNIYSNYSANGSEIYTSHPIVVTVDTFTVMQPTGYHAASIDSISFDILNAIILNQVNADLFVSTSGSDTNDGLSQQTPLKTIQYAVSSILADSTNPRTIHVSDGVYSPLATGEIIPIFLADHISLIGETETGVILDADGTTNVLINYYNTAISISNLTITDGLASNVSGGIFCAQSKVNISYVTITGNSTSGIAIQNSQANISNVTITGNAGGIGVRSSNVKLINSIVWNNSDYEVAFNDPTEIPVTSTMVIANSIIEGGLDSITVYDNVVHWAEGNIGADPLFVDPDHGNYSLQPGSPAIDSGTALFVWEGDTIIDLSSDDYDGNAPDMGAIEYPHALSNNDDTPLPESYSLNQNYPNPFNPTTTISYSLPEQSSVKLTVFDIRGQEVANLQQVERSPGNYEVQWNGIDQSGNPVSTGVYFARLQAGEYSQTIKMLYLK
ncbi:MAG: T9SS type A sorting domain-containing protein [Candidatus Marinimicrobia bacterium]|nr:T9SS type A sorting domain-containing protein [Candidatus Neomarinimicrobiota bacterium]